MKTKHDVEKVIKDIINKYKEITFGTDSPIASCFSCFTVKILKYFYVIAVRREKGRLIPLNAIPTGRPTPLANVAIETPPVITVDVIRPVSTMLVIVLNRFIFFASHLQTSNSSSKYASISVNYFNRYACGSCGAVGLSYILISLSYMLIVFI